MTRPQSSGRLGRFVDACAGVLMHRRRLLLLLCLAVTVALGCSATRLRLDPGFNKMIPLQHPYMQVFTKYANTFSGANTVLVSLRWKGDGDIYNAAFMDKLRHATDEVFFIPGVDRSRVFSLFTPNVRYTEVTEAGFRGDVVVPGRFSGAPDELDKVRRNVARSGQIGRLVSNDLRSALIRAELRETDPATGKTIDYGSVARQLEKIRAQFSGQDVEVNVVGFAKLVGDVEEGIAGVMGFFALAFAVTALLLWLYTRSLRITVLALVVALLPVGWLLGLLPLLGYGIDPMSILVPFLIFSIGVSHAVQMTNAWKQEVVQGHSPLESANAAFRKLFIPGTVALLTNALGFMVIMRIEIDIVRELGITACLGVLLMIVTNKVFLPILLSYTRLEPSALARSQARRAHGGGGLWHKFGALARPAPALGVFVAALALLAAGAIESRGLKIGDVGSGAPELRADSRYNRDSASIVSQYNIGSDALTVVVEPTGFDDGCLHYPVMSAVERFEMHMRGVSGVQSVVSVSSLAKVVIGAYNEGNPRWEALPRSAEGLSQGAKAYDPDNGMNTSNCQAIQVLIYTANHEGATIAHIVREIRRFTAADKTANVAFRLAGGNIGVMAATNEAVEEAEVAMLLAIFGAITLLCLLTFRSWRAVLCIIVPLTLVSVLCNALMARLGIGLKVSTLPVITLGVGVGVDYGIYLYERIQHQIREEGQALPQAFAEAMRQRGSAALFTALTMCIGVGTWAFAALKFQADMGILLAFMFLVNLFGAVSLLPALAAWLGVEQEERARVAAGVAAGADTTPPAHALKSDAA
ncbi:efflux RND transporter permease subunit [Cupriavidus oxalaticus]|uniref:MMPL family transporter n=1 Tax=Cupriavidus oxalaticus TaxID=96344 RepID=A0A375GE66_9BURK|nr:efflux RND transporter permease subunit [Cupriavidus oxalaticus]QRQ84065.1 MMPL family transporter [Cupriavidus oxalaticus]QRQ91846.1 MMPL family transporter [Cupriavidus oxalaticus]WQD86436.1 efflux RND transporter permease subunit [Cupriavidus oxalaticus]SPC17695.1 Predicted exporter of the RND superfamily [Cupriavidus oxalaticus]